MGKPEMMAEPIDLVCFQRNRG